MPMLMLLAGCHYLQPAKSPTGGRSGTLDGVSGHFSSIEQSNSPVILYCAKFVTGFSVFDQNKSLRKRQLSRLFEGSGN